MWFFGEPASCSAVTRLEASRCASAAGTGAAVRTGTSTRAIVPSGEETSAERVAALADGTATSATSVASRARRIERSAVAAVSPRPRAFEALLRRRLRRGGRRRRRALPEGRDRRLTLIGAGFL